VFSGKSVFVGESEGSFSIAEVATDGEVRYTKRTTDLILYLSAGRAKRREKGW
jgi:hypothetical protein